MKKLKKRKGLAVSSASAPIGKTSQLKPLHSSSTLEQTLQKAREYKRTGQLSQAETLYRQILLTYPDHAPAQNNLGNIHAQRGESVQAATCFRQALAINPDFVEARYNLGLCLRETGDLQGAIACFQQVLLVNPHTFPAHVNLGLTLENVGEIEQAISSYKQALALNPQSFETCYLLGNCLRKTGQLDEAITRYQQAIRLRPDSVDAIVNLGLALGNRGDIEQAIACYRRAISLRPQSFAAHYNLGVCLRETKNIIEAISCCRQAIALDPKSSAAYHNLSICLRDTGDFDEAIACSRQAIALDPKSIDTLINLGNILQIRGEINQAVACFQQALSIDPHHHELYGIYLLSSLYLPHLTHEEVFADACSYGRQMAAKFSQEQIKSRKKSPHQPLRVGLVSADLRAHPVGIFLEQILLNLDSNKIQLYAYANQKANDEVSARLQNYFHAWCNVETLSDQELIQLITDDKIDILVDLSGHTKGNRLSVFACKPCPIQVSWLGYANTTGLDTMDYILADSITVPEDEEQFYTEKVWRLPETYLCFTPPDLDIEVGNLPALETEVFTFGCCNNPTKINNSVIDCWAAILNSLPEATFFFKYAAFKDQATRKRVEEGFRLHGINPARLIFEEWSPRDEYLASYRKIDLALDPFPFPGGTTTCEALWMGVPTLTLAVKRGIVGHNGELIMKSVGLNDWVADSVEEYIAKAIVSAQNKEQLANLRSTLRQRLLASPLCDAPRFARQLATTFQEMQLTGKNY
jgi:protein O-GlcNAc transferase